ncbi:endonuclease domain-containing protein [Curtobacterium sp. VKM Ac-2922]|uniref:endonuclease domain-containing protein n=1 Tax=Curtobacterium sp. VKM Ac-2922 TaxID=2929475 RepID=UPI001FB3666B|nr:endonuclease domain-containing protein [Curtobacterium sp. VKM Ac-2922]MCJ1714502.1 endonuclease domain-containing protein [Curtobacterium sp. VKM Ac-2922]
MPRLRPLPGDLGRGAFRVSDAAALGVNAERLRRSDLSAPVHGVRVVMGNEGFASFIEALAVVMRPDQFFSHTTAARLWGAPLPRAVQDDPTVHVSTTADRARMRRPNVRAHRLSAAQAVEHSGLSLATPATAWAQCASLLGVRALVAVGDHFVGRSEFATTIDALGAAIVPGSRSSVVARTAADLVRVGSESAMESWFRLALVDAGFPEPELNVDVRDPDGRLLGRVDMAWPELKIAFEYDGDHHRERDVFQHDQRRDNGFVVNDWIAVHATASDAHRPAAVFERLRQAFEQRLGSTRRLAA